MEFYGEIIVDLNTTNLYVDLYAKLKGEIGAYLRPDVNAILACRSKHGLEG